MKALYGSKSISAIRELSRASANDDAGTRYRQLHLSARKDWRVSLLRGNQAQILPGIDAGAMAVVPGWLQGIIADRAQIDNGVGTARRQFEDVVRGMFQTHIGVTAAAFDAGAGFAQMRERVAADQSVIPSDLETRSGLVECNTCRSLTQRRTFIQAKRTGMILIRATLVKRLFAAATIQRSRRTHR